MRSLTDYIAIVHVNMVLDLGARFISEMWDLQLTNQIALLVTTNSNNYYIIILTSYLFFLSLIAS